MIERRKKLYCGSKHELIPVLMVLANVISEIQKESNDITMLNYAGKARLINILAKTGAIEVDKLILIDNRNVERAEGIEVADRNCPN